MNSPDPTSQRILFLVPSLRRAGAETQVVDLVNALDSRRFQKHLAVFESRLDQVDRIDPDSVTVHRLRRRGKLGLALARDLARIIFDNDIDVVHCTLQISLFFASLACWLTRARPRLIVALHTTVNKSTRDELYDRFLYRRLIRRCDRVVFVCRAQAEHWIERFPEIADRATVVYNGVDPAVYDPAKSEAAGLGLRHELHIRDDQPVVGCIAGLRPEKGHQFLLRAFALLSGDPCLLLAGDGPERIRIEALASELGIGDRVRLLGEIRDVQPVIAASDVTVLASTAVETFSMAMLESMAMAVPVVATRMGGLAEAITPGVTGDLVCPADIPDLRKALQRMIEDVDARRRMGTAARERVRSAFSVRAMADSTTRVFDAVLGSTESSTARSDGID